MDFEEELHHIPHDKRTAMNAPYLSIKQLLLKSIKY
jgi:hypothetical protein